MTLAHFRSTTLGILIAFALLSVGCSKTNGSANGIVRFDDGSPVQSGSIEFRSLLDESCYASRIATDGSFTLVNLDGKVGCPPGNYEVVVVQIVLTEDLAAEAHEHGRTVPRRYADYYTSGLRATIDVDPGTPLLITLETPGNHRSVEEQS